MTSRLAQADNGNRSNSQTRRYEDLTPPTEMQKIVGAGILTIVFCFFICILLLARFWSFFVVLALLLALLFLLMIRAIFVFDENYGVSSQEKWIPCLIMGIYFLLTIFIFLRYGLIAGFGMIFLYFLLVLWWIW